MAKSLILFWKSNIILETQASDFPTPLCKRVRDVSLRNMTNLVNIIHEPDYMAHDGITVFDSWAIYGSLREFKG